MVYRSGASGASNSIFCWLGAKRWSRGAAIAALAVRSHHPRACSVSSQNRGTVRLLSRLLLVDAGRGWGFLVPMSATHWSSAPLVPPPICAPHTRRARLPSATVTCHRRLPQRESPRPPPPRPPAHIPPHPFSSSNCPLTPPSPEFPPPTDQNNLIKHGRPNEDCQEVREGHHREVSLPYAFAF